MEFRFPSAKPAPLSIKKQLAAQRYLLGLLDLKGRPVSRMRVPAGSDQDSWS